MQSVKNALASKLYSAIVEKFGKEPPASAQLAEMLEYPPDPAMGHLAFPCFKLSRDLRMGPPVIAAKLAEGFSCDYISECSVAGGYLNFRIDSAAFINHVMGDIAEKGDSYGSPANGNGKTVVLDYSSPNVAKPFHIGHLGTTVIGHALRLLHEFAGFKCVGVNHLGDWGTQFGKMIVAYRRWGDPEKVANGGCDGLVELYVKFHEEAEKDAS
ncbi:MAG: arginine--tRNA ligase, partial [Clostridia bacterium]|nr:arginine--tRNA ligase [Clostridia bacterium]